VDNLHKGDTKNDDNNDDDNNNNNNNNNNNVHPLHFSTIYNVDLVVEVIYTPWLLPMYEILTEH
jgi:hypothetical protein